MVSGETLKAHQALYKGDARGWQQQARLLQSLWRERRGLAPRGPGDHDGSYLPDVEAVAKTGAAYISTDALAALRHALETKEHGAVLQEKRLWCNLLSSQPLCFNLFGALSQHVDDPRTTAALQAVWPDIERVTAILYEHSPGRGSDVFLGNRTAFDVYIEYVDIEGSQRFIGIEVKYHEDLSGKAPDLRERPRSVLRESVAFVEGAEATVTTGRSAQLLLDHLLALSMNTQPGPRGRFVILYPAANIAVESQVKTYQSNLVDTDDTFQPLTLEAFVAGLRTALDQPWLGEFEKRYLNVAAIARLETSNG